MSTVPSSRRLFGIQFSVLARRWRQALDLALANTGLTDATWGPLIHLRESGDGVLQKTLAARVGIDGSTLVRLIDILEARGLVERRADAADRRARLIFLTESGRGAVEAIARALAEAEDDMLVELSDAEITAALAAFEKIRRRLDSRTDVPVQPA
ncbi:MULTISPECIES: MarR family winged helix-turn-helix transcriptional regulator [unclassified Brevundimonas]|uniref:MarR family winged helix-turn-helix transcriptional regulator n=1 Tax=unclassified Brevundimonas TaxID=2622653 RepID=UPI003F90751F